MLTQGQSRRIFLMTSGDRYQQYWMDTSDTQVFFFRKAKTEKGVLVHELADLHISSIDSPEKKVLCKSRRHFGIQLSTTTGHRKLYFLTHQMMLDGIDYLLRAQGYNKRINQYKFRKYLANNEINDRWLAKHRRTNEVFEVKQAPRWPANNPIRELMLNELKVLQHTTKCKFCVELVDYFEEDDHVYLISRYSNKTLRNYITHKQIERMTEEESYKFVGQIAFCLDKLH